MVVSSVLTPCRKERANVYTQIWRGSPPYDITLKGDGSGCCFPFHSGYEL